MVIIVMIVSYQAILMFQSILTRTQRSWVLPVASHDLGWAIHILSLPLIFFFLINEFGIAIIKPYRIVLKVDRNFSCNFF